MTHAVSLTHERYEHMSPTAVALATLLHVAVAAALFMVSPLRPVDTTPDAIEITLDAPPPPVETPPPAEPPPPATAPAAAAPPPAATPAPVPAAPPVRLGLAPVGPSQDPKQPPGTAQPDKPRPPTPEPQAAQPEPPKPPVEEAKAEPPAPEPPPPEPQQQAMATTPPPPPPPPPPSQALESALPPVDAPPPPVTAREIPPPAPPPPAPKAPPPTQARVQPAPPPPPVHAPQNPALRSSPLSTAPQQRTPAEQQQAARQAPSFINPAQSYGTKRLEDQYVWQVANKLSAHQQFVRNALTESGTVVLRLVIARDGRLVEVGLNRSSGNASLDQASINMVRAAAPYPPMPSELGAQHTFSLPLYFKRSD